jgi:hypothetical protein
MTICLFFLTGCQTLNVGIQTPKEKQLKTKYKKHSPPPHAPAHGYRYKRADGNELQFDSKLGVYAVIKTTDTFFGKNLYLKLSSDGKWIVSTTLKDEWRIAVGNEVPPKLKESKRKKEKPHKKKKK